jgi:hypothetical protein
MKYTDRKQLEVKLREAFTAVGIEATMYDIEFAAEETEKIAMRIGSIASKSLRLVEQDPTTDEATYAGMYDQLEVSELIIQSIVDSIGLIKQDH